MGTSSTSGGKEVLDRPENWEDMVEKYEEREAELVKRALERQQVGSVDELKNVAIESMNIRSSRTAKEHQTLKDHKILREEKSEEIKTLRQKINEEITSFAREVMKQFPSLEKPLAGLKGRVTAKSDENKP